MLRRTSATTFAAAVSSVLGQPSKCVYAITDSSVQGHSDTNLSELPFIGVGFRHATVVRPMNRLIGAHPLFSDIADIHDTFLVAVQLRRHSVSPVSGDDRTYTHVYVIDPVATTDFIKSWKPTYNPVSRRGITQQTISESRSIPWQAFQHAIRVHARCDSANGLKSTGSIADLIETWDAVILFHPDGKAAPSTM